MAKVTVVKQENYTVIDNGIFKDARLSFKAKGILTTMLSLPPTWNYTIEGLKTLAKDGKDSIKTALKELENFGYLERKQVRNDDGSFCDLEYFVYEKPQTKEPKAENPSTDKSLSEKPLQLNTDIPSTDKTNTNTVNTDGLNTDDKYALEDKKQSSKENIYASVPEKQEEPASKKQNRYIPQDYTEEQLIEHIKKPIFDYMKSEYGGMASEEMSDELINIIVLFHREYEKHFGNRHRVLSDKAYENVVDRYMNPPEEMTDDYSIETYEAMMQRYFEVNYNQRGKYKGEITLGLSHFMSDNVRNNLYCQTCK